jgi:exonuclease SbcC
MSDPRGSVWRKWDLHVHTPDSLVQHYGGSGSDVWDKFIEELRNLPSDFKVLGINDYIFLDGYKKLLAAKAEGKLPNIELLLPVIELRLDKFGGSNSGLSRVNYHIIFSNKIDPSIIESQFLGALCSKYVLTPEFDSIRSSGKWAAVPTRQSIEDLGKLIIESVPASKRADFRAPIIAGFNNLCLSLGVIQEVLKSPYFSGKVLTAVGKTEWANIKWNDQSIADKKTIINSANLVFISSATADEYANAKKSLTDGGVNNRLLDCSDAHRWAASSNKDRLGKCFTWIKADPTFEGLRQAVFEYPSRVHVADVPPIAPVLQIKKVTMKFPANTFLSRGERSDIFCFSGEHEIVFSPYLTCIIGGRGAGKSTLLNLIHEKLDGGGTEFFRQNRLLPVGTSVATSVTIDGVSEKGVVEFLQQNEIEQFASDHQRLTAAIFSRLGKLDTKGLLKEKESAVDAAIAATKGQLSRLRSYHELSLRLNDAKNELATQKSIVESLQNVDYKRIADELRDLNKELQGLKTSKVRLEKLLQDLRALLANYPVYESSQVPDLNAYEQQVRGVIEVIEAAIADAARQQSLQAAAAREQELAGRVKELRGELDKYLRDRGLSEENLSDVGNATEKIEQLNDEIGSLDVRVGTLKEELSHFTVHSVKAQEYVNAVEERLAPVNVALRGQGVEVKPIELRYSLDPGTFKEAMIQYVASAIGQIEGRAPRPDYVESKLGNVDFFSLTDRESALKHISGDDGVYARRLREFFSNEMNFEALKLEAEIRLLDVRKRGRILVLYDDKPVESLSFGQRCTAVIVVLLLLGNMPVVIDEPEAHLDSSLIAKYLVALIKSRKLHRQIIFATHNANLVINGDAELVHCMSMDDTKVTTVRSTSIENLAYRNLLLALEGGEEAFLQRDKRYGID